MKFLKAKVIDQNSFCSVYLHWQGDLSGLMNVKRFLLPFKSKCLVTQFLLILWHKYLLIRRKRTTERSRILGQGHQNPSLLPKYLATSLIIATGSTLLPYAQRRWYVEGWSGDSSAGGDALNTLCNFPELSEYHQNELCSLTEILSLK